MLFSSYTCLSCKVICSTRICILSKFFNLHEPNFCAVLTMCLEASPNFYSLLKRKLLPHLKISAISEFGVVIFKTCKESSFFTVIIIMRCIFNSIACRCYLCTFHFHLIYCSSGYFWKCILLIYLLFICYTGLYTFFTLCKSIYWIL